MEQQTPPSRRNIELKARCADLDLAREAVRRFGAAPAGVLAQRDTYFRCGDGRLKLREWNQAVRRGFLDQGAELIWYRRDDRAAPRGSDYRVVPVADPGGMRALLSAALGVRGDVVKRRELWFWENVRLHLDAVDGLGAFVEFEAVLDPGESEEAAHAKLRSLRAALGIADADLLAQSYSDLLGI